MGYNMSPLSWLKKSECHWAPVSSLARLNLRASSDNTKRGSERVFEEFNRVIFSKRNGKKHKIRFWIGWQIADDWFTLCDSNRDRKVPARTFPVLDREETNGDVAQLVRAAES